MVLLAKELAKYDHPAPGARRLGRGLARSTSSLLKRTPSLRKTASFPKLNTLKFLSFSHDSFYPRPATTRESTSGAGGIPTRDRNTSFTTKRIASLGSPRSLSGRLGLRRNSSKANTTREPDIENPGVPAPASEPLSRLTEASESGYFEASTPIPDPQTPAQKPKTPGSGAVSSAGGPSTGGSDFYPLSSESPDITPRPTKTTIKRSSGVLSHSMDM